MLLLAASLPNARAAPTDVDLPDSIRQVDATPPVGKPDPLRAFISRRALTSAESDVPLEFEVALKMRNFAELQAQVSRGKHVSPAEMAEKYEPLAADYQAVIDWAQGEGLTVTRLDPRHMALFVRGKISRIAPALKVNFSRVTFRGKEYSSAVTAPRVPAAISPLLVGINGLQPHLHPHKHIIHPNSAGGAAPYTPSQIAQAYKASGLYNTNITGSGQTIAIVIDTFPSAEDLISFWQACGVNQSIGNIDFIQAVSGTLATPSGEETLDTEWSSSIAPGAKVRVYAATDLANVDLDETYLQVYDDVRAHPTLEIHQMSMSYGEGEIETTNSQMSTDDQYFMELANAGVTCFASSGDEGATPGEDEEGNPNEDGSLEVESPASDPYVTGVGGTSLTLDANNNETGEVVWNNSIGAGGGGTSDFWSRPSWQRGPGVPGGTMRLVPDIACAADPTFGAETVFQGSAQTFGGTSWAAPTCAGFCALINEARANVGRSAIGQLNLQIYPLIGTANFRDITSGNNATTISGSTSGIPNYTAGPGYDEASGIGVPLVQTLAETLAGSVNLLGVGQEPAVETINLGQNATFTASANGSPTGYQWQRMPIGAFTWSNLSDNGVYSGSATTSLTVTDATTAMSGDQFQCVVTYAGAGTVTSAPLSVLVVETPWVIATVAGDAGTSGLTNNTGLAAQFNYPTGIVIDSSGNLYIADLYNNAIRKVTPAGVVTTPYGSLTGESGSTNGTGNGALFYYPRDLAIDSSNNLYVSDEGNNLIRKITMLTGQVSTLGATASPAFSDPKGIAVDSSGSVYVADYGNNVIRKIATNGTVSILAGSSSFTAGYANGSGTTQALFNGPIGLALDSVRNIYVTDYGNEVVRKITTGGVVSTLAGQAGITGCLDGPGAHALFNVPRGIAVDGSGNLYVTDSYAPFSVQLAPAASGNNLLRKITSAGVVSTLAGQTGVPGSANGAGSAAEFYNPCGVALATSGNLYIADASNNTIRMGSVLSTTTISVAATAEPMIFGLTPGQFAVTRTGNTSASQIVNYSTGGSAISGTDYTALSGTVTIPAGMSSASIAVDPLQNNQGMPNPTVQITLSPAVSYVVGNPGTATVTIEALTAFQSWKIAEFGANATVAGIGGDTDDPNHNGVPNFLEYAFNSNPLQTGTEPLPAFSEVEDSGGLQYLALTFTELNTDPNLTFTVQVTGDLAQATDQWHSGSNYTTVVSQTVNGNTTQVTVRDNTPISQASKRFIRVQVSGN